MVRNLIAWALSNPVIVIVLVLALAGVGSYAFVNVNVEAYPDPAPAIIEVIAQYPGASFGGDVKRYEVRPDPEQLKRYGITLQQLQNALANNNANVGAGFLTQGATAINVRGIGLVGRGDDPLQQSVALPDAYVANRRL